MRAITLAAIALAGALCASAQFSPTTPLQPRYQANKTSTLNSATEKVTVQATATSGPVSFEYALVYCSVACTMTVQINGAAATATSLALVGPLGPTSGIAPLAFSGSNVSGGTTLQTWYLAAGQQVQIPLTAYYLPPGAGGGSNLSIGTNSITGTASIQIQFVNQ